MTATDPTARGWWSDLWSRLWRQAVQVIVPPLTIASTAGLSGFGWKAILLTLIGGAVVTVVRAVADVRAAAGAARWVQILDRALAAAAGSALGWAGVDGFDVASTPWVTVVQSAFASAVLAVAWWMLDPPGPEPTTTYVPDTGDGGYVDVRVSIAAALLMALAGIVLSAVLLQHPAPDHSASGPDNKSWAVVLS